MPLINPTRPYFFHFFEWRTLPELLRLKGQGSLPLLESGYPMLVATLVQALVVSLVLILLPLRVLTKGSTQECTRRIRATVAAYFGTIGVAFMFVEIAFIQKFVLLLHHPLYAVAVALFAFLLSAGLASRWSERLSAVTVQRHRTVVLPVLAIVVTTLVYAAVLPWLLPVVAARCDPVRIAVAVALSSRWASSRGCHFHWRCAPCGRSSARSCLGLGPSMHAPRS